MTAPLGDVTLDLWRAAIVDRACGAAAARGGRGRRVTHPHERRPPTLDELELAINSLARAGEVLEGIGLDASPMIQPLRAFATRALLSRRRRGRRGLQAAGRSIAADVLLRLPPGDLAGIDRDLRVIRDRIAALADVLDEAGRAGDATAARHRFWEVDVVLDRLARIRMRHGLAA